MGGLKGRADDAALMRPRVVSTRMIESVAVDVPAMSTACSLVTAAPARYRLRGRLLKPAEPCKRKAEGKRGKRGVFVSQLRLALSCPMAVVGSISFHDRLRALAVPRRLACWVLADDMRSRGARALLVAPEGTPGV